jgi:hypothetical protein
VSGNDLSLYGSGQSWLARYLQRRDDLEQTLAQLVSEHDIEPERPPYRVSGKGSPICFVSDPDRWLTNCC